MRILELQLVTTALPQQRDFYAGVFGFPALRAAPDTLVLQAGSSRLTFTATDSLAGVYHFAFNIPENQFSAAKQWISRHVPLIALSSGADEFYSESWDAHMLYFYDPAGNIVELIARHTLPQTSDAPFAGSSVLDISEIGVAAEDVPARVAEIHARTGAAEYHGPGRDTFTAVGDEHGLFIVVKRGRIWFPETGKPAEHLPVTVVTGSAANPITSRFK